MKKPRFLLIVMVLIIMTLSLVSLGFAGKPSLACDNSTAKPTVAVLVVNNAKTTFDADLTNKVTTGIMTKLTGLYQTVPGDVCLEKLAKAGITDIATAEKEDLARVLGADGIKYVVYAEIEPFVRKERFMAVSYGLDMTAVVPFRIIDLYNNENIYNGKFVEQARETAVIGFGIKNKTAAMQALDKVMFKISEALTARLPL